MMDLEIRNETWCIIPARGGSKGIQKKNITDICGKPLLQYSIDYAKESGCVDKIVVSTDDPEIAQVGGALGAIIPELRPEGISGDTANVSDAYWHGVDSYSKIAGYAPAKILVLYPTSPFRPDYLLREAVSELEVSFVYMIYQRFSYEKGVFGTDHNGKMSRMPIDQAYKQLGLLYGTRYCPPDCRPEQSSMKFAKFVSQNGFKNMMYSMRVFDYPSYPWDIDIDTMDDVRVAESYLNSSV